MSAELRAQAAEWLARRQRGDGTADEARAFAEWLATSEAHRRAWAEAEALWRELGKLERLAAPQLAEARRQYRRRETPVWRRPHLMLVVAVSAALLAIGIPLLEQAGTGSPVVLVTATGERRSIMLTDGSSIELDSGTRAEVGYSWWSRRVRLIEGQALFTVAHERWRGFEVEVGDVRVVDLGTRFEVRRLGGTTAVAVLDGAVDVLPRPGRPATRLTPGLGVEVAASGTMAPVRPIAVESAAAWRRDELIVRDQPLAAVLAELVRYHPAEISTATADMLTVRITGVFPTNDLPLALETLAAVLPARLVAIGEGRWRFDLR
jgi:transmembrane sensor